MSYTKAEQLKSTKTKKRKKNTPRKKTGLYKKCLVCNKKFYVMPSGTSKKFCSTKCAGLGQRKRVLVKCTVCGKKFEKIKSEQVWNKKRGYKNIVCSNECLLKARSKTNKGKIKSKIWSLRQADKIFSDFIRSRDNWTCRNCGKDLREKSGQLHNSHFWARGRMATRFDENNCIALCYHCHYWVFEKEKQGKYRELMIKWLGEEKYKELEEKANLSVKKTTAILEFMERIKPYLNEREEIEKRFAFVGKDIKTNNCWMVSNEDIKNS